MTKYIKQGLEDFMYNVYNNKLGFIKENFRGITKIYHRVATTKDLVLQNFYLQNM